MLGSNSSRKPAMSSDRRIRSSVPLEATQTIASIACTASATPAIGFMSRSKAAS